MAYAGVLDKTMGAETAGHLQLMIDTAIRRATLENRFGLGMFLGVDGRIFSSAIPDELDPQEYRLLNLVKTNLGHICHQLRLENMLMSIQKFEAGTVVICGVGERAFLVFLTTMPIEVTQMDTVLGSVLRTSIVVRHIFESRPITPEILSEYDEPVGAELKRLTRIVFLEKFKESREVRKNRELEAWLKSKLSPLVGPGPLSEMLTMAYNEVGTSVAFMTPSHWDRLLTIVLERLRELQGDTVAEKAEREWRGHFRQVLASFV